MKPLHLVMAAGLAVSAWLALFADKDPQESVVEPTLRPAVQTGTQQSSAPPAAATGNNRAAAILQLKPRDELIGEDGIAGGGDLFAARHWGAPPAPAIDASPAAAARAPEPTFTYLGKKQEDGVWEVYLAYQDQTLIVREKSIIERTYRVDAIRPPSLVLTYLPSSRRQTVMIGEAQ